MSKVYRRVEKRSSRCAHNAEIASSNLASATKTCPFKFRDLSCEEMREAYGRNWFAEFIEMLEAARA
jgi:hypothetical protein